MNQDGTYDKRTGEAKLSSSVLVINKFYTPINVINAKRAFILLYKNIAEAIEGEKGEVNSFKLIEWISYSERKANNPTDHEEFIRTARFQILIPRVIRLILCNCLPKHDIKFTKRNVLVRDGHRCQYCGRKYTASKLTVDHIVPKSRGGRSVWTNVVSACIECNMRKGGKLPWEVGMKLIRQPTIPRRNPIIVDRVNSDRYRIWNYFLKDALAE